MKPRDEWIREFHQRTAEIESLFDVLEDVAGITPEGRLMEGVYALVEGYTDAIEAAFPECKEWLSWWLCECRLGQKPKEVRTKDGEARLIESVDDLIWIIGKDAKK